MKTNKLLLTMVLIITALLFIPNAVNAADGDTFTISTTEANFNYTIISEESATVELTSYVSLYQAETSAEIASTVEYNSKTYNVTKIGDRAFSNCSWLQSVTIPTTVTEIGEFAFEYCLNLTQISELTNITTIGASAFEGCSKLASVSMPNVKTIGNRAFAYCNVLGNVTIPEGVTTIEGGVFANCQAFTNIEIPEGVTSIGLDAFSFCENLANVILPSTLTEIQGGAFYNCTKLTAIEIPENVRIIGTDFGNGVYGSGAFDGTGLTTIVIPKSVEKMIGYTFANCANLTFAEILNPNTELYLFETFYECKNLKTIKAYPGSNFGREAIENNITCMPIYNVEKNLTNLKTDYESRGIDYEIILIPEEGYGLPTNVTVTVGGNILNPKQSEYDEGYSYDNITGSLKIDYWSIKGDIVIVAKAEQQYKIELDIDNVNLEYVNINENDVKQMESLMINKGNSLFIRINAMPEYLIDEISFDGKLGTIKPANQYWEFSITPESDMKIKITTKSNVATYDLTMGTAEGLTVTPTGTMKVNGRENIDIKIIEEDGYRLEGVYAMIKYHGIDELSEEWVPLYYEDEYIMAKFECPNQWNIENIKIRIESKKGIKSVKELQTALGGEQYAKVEDNVITLQKDISLDKKGLWIIAGEYILDLNGHKVSIDDEFEDWAIFEIGRQTKFTINDSSNGNGKIDGKYASALVVLDEALLTINGGSFTASDIITANQQSAVIINNGNFTADFAAFAMFEEAKVTINGGTFVAKEGDAVVYIGEGELIINEGKFEGNPAALLINIFDAENVNIKLKGGEFKRRSICNN